MSIKKPYRVRPVLFSVGFFFLLNADINIVDILPDVIGWGLICLALYGLHDLSYKLEQAIKYSALLALLSLVKGLVLVGGNVYINPSNTLLYTFVFSLISLALTVLFTSAFFEGLAHLAVRGESKRVPAECSGAQNFSYLFFIIKSVLAVLPELVALAQTDEILDASSSALYYSLLDLKPYFTIIQFSLVTLLGVAWYIIIRQLFKVFKEDRELLTYLEDRYVSVILSDGRLMLRRSLRSGLLLCAVGCIGFITIVVDKMNVLPEFLSAAFLFAGSYILAKRQPSFKSLYAPVTALIAASLLSFAAELVIKETDVNYGFLKAMKAVPLDATAIVLSAAVAAGTAWCAVALQKAVGKLAYEYCLPGAKEEWEKVGTGGMVLFCLLCATASAAKIILSNALFQNSAAVFLLTLSGTGLAIYMARRIFLSRDAVMKGTF